MDYDRGIGNNKTLNFLLGKSGMFPTGMKITHKSFPDKGFPQQGLSGGTILFSPLGNPGALLSRCCESRAPGLRDACR